MVQMVQKIKLFELFNSLNLRSSQSEEDLNSFLIREINLDVSSVAIRFI